jgi:hypothetical protein
MDDLTKMDVMDVAKQTVRNCAHTPRMPKSTLTPNAVNPADGACFVCIAKLLIDFGEQVRREQRIADAQQDALVNEKRDEAAPSPTKEPTK